MEKKCLNCMYWFHMKDMDVEGLNKCGNCRLFPKSIIKYENEWCGQFKLEQLKGEENNDPNTSL